LAVAARGEFSSICSSVAPSDAGIEEKLTGKSMRIGASATILGALFFVSFAANAASPFAKTKLDSVVVHDFGNQILLGLPTAASNGESCEITNVLVIQKTHPSCREMYSAVLSAFQAGGNIQGWVHGCDATFKAPVLIRLDLVR